MPLLSLLATRSLGIIIFCHFIYLFFCPVVKQAEGVKMGAVEACVCSMQVFTDTLHALCQKQDKTELTRRALTLSALCCESQGLNAENETRTCKVLSQRIMV